MLKHLSILGILLALLPANRATGATIIGDWEGGSSDSWIDWGTQSGYSGGATSLPSPKYQSSSIGATSGTSSLLLTQAGYNQNLAVKLEYIPGAMAAFFANNALQFDVTLPATATSGYAQIYEVALNAPGWGFAALTTNPVPGAQWGWGAGGGPQQTYTVTIDYSTALGSIPTNAGYAEFILSTNNDGSHSQFYFDNAQLVTIPEPASGLIVVGVASLPLLRRRRA